MQIFSHHPLSRATIVVFAGLALAGLGLAISSRAAQGPAFAPPPISSLTPTPALPDANAAAAVAPQPFALQALDATHFVVVTREPRLVTPVGQEGRAMNMILHVVTYYSVQEGRLIPVEHVHVPPGYRVVDVGQ